MSNLPNVAISKALVLATDISLDRERIIPVLESKEFSWDLFGALCVKHKVAGLVHQQFQQAQLLNFVPTRVHILLHALRVYTGQRNIFMVDEIKAITTDAKRQGVDMRPTKGAALLGWVYEDASTRLMVDLDFFARRRDIGRIRQFLEGRGYVQGKFDRDRLDVTPFSKAEYLIASQASYVLPSFVRIPNHELVRAISVDVAHSLGVSPVADADELIMAEHIEANGIPSLDRHDLFIHLCVHLHKELKRAHYTAKGHGLGLIKFCDVLRCFLSVAASDTDIRKIFDRARQLHVNGEVFFAVSITNDFYENDHLSKLIALFQESDNTDFDQESWLTMSDNIGRVTARREYSPFECLSFLDDRDYLTSRIEVHDSTIIANSPFLDPS